MFLGPELALVALTLNVYEEARSESYHGQLAVAETTINRVVDTRWPSDVASVVLQRRQFSWVGAAGITDGNDLMSYQQRLLDKVIDNEIDLNAYRQAEAVAKKVLTAGYKPRYTFTHYHTTAIQPVWTKGQTNNLTIGTHKFYNVPRTY
ncbi:MAG: cell wall hydrolase [Plesiomonas sp.]